VGYGNANYNIPFDWNVESVRQKIAAYRRLTRLRAAKCRQNQTNKQSEHSARLKAVDSSHN